MTELSEKEREEIVEAIRQGRALPARYQASLFGDATEAEVIWPGKSNDIERVTLPFQSIEHIDEPRSETVAQPTLFSMDSLTGRQVGGWTNKLIWGDNKLILSSLANGPLRKQIDEAGGLKMVYIDPPFDVGADFSVEVDIGDDSVTKQPSVIEEFAYRDTWGQGRDSYAAMIYERLLLIKNLMADNSAVWIHCDHRVVALIRMIGDEIFGKDSFQNMVTWRRQVVRGMKVYAKYMPFSADYLLLFTIGKNPVWNPVDKVKYITIAEADKKYMKDAKGYFRTSDPGTSSNESLIQLHSEGRIYVTNGGEVVIKDGVISATKGNLQIIYRREIVGSRVEERTVIDNIWDDIPGLGVVSGESVNYPTQKPTGLLKRIIESTTNPGDLIADFFCGSGTTMVVAEELERKWIGADLGRFAIHTARKRLIAQQRHRREAGATYRAFEVLNLGSYERQYFSGVDLSLPEAERQAESLQRQEQFISMVLQAYGAQRSEQLPGFHGVKEKACVLVGPIDAPVTQTDVRNAIASALKQNATRIDILGFEFEMGIKPAMADEAKEQGLVLTLRYIPNDVFDRRAIAKGDVRFFDVGYVEFKPSQDKNGQVSVSLTDFGVFYVQDDADSAAAGLKSGAKRIVIDGGQVVRVSKDNNGLIKKETLTKSWTDWIDYWAVDFDYESQREVVTIQEGDGTKSVWTGRYLFENQWQDFRTKDNRSITTTSAPHSYAVPGEYKIAVKVVDVFGNDTTKVVKFTVK